MWCVVCRNLQASSWRRARRTYRGRAATNSSAKPRAARRRYFLPMNQNNTPSFIQSQTDVFKGVCPPPSATHPSFHPRPDALLRAPSSFFFITLKPKIGRHTYESQIRAHLATAAQFYEVVAGAVPRQRAQTIHFDVSADTSPDSSSH